MLENNNSEKKINKNIASAENADRKCSLWLSNAETRALTFILTLNTNIQEIYNTANTL